MEFTVYLKNWHNNYSDPIDSEPFDDFDKAKEYADKYDTFEVEDMGNNCYVNNGCQTWIEDQTGKVVYEPM